MPAAHWPLQLPLWQSGVSVSPLHTFARPFAHAPQLCGSLWTFTQVPPQSVVPGGHTGAHAPAEHLLPGVHFVLQLPQYCESACRLTHAFPPGAEQAVGVAFPHMIWQEPDVQLAEPVAAPDTTGSHFVAQLPQWFRSFCALTHAIPHLSGRDAFPHVKSHLPATHSGVPLAGAVHGLLQLPQFARSVCSSTHASPHFDSVPLHAKPQLPAVQVGVPPLGAEHTWLHIMQLVGSLIVSTHASPHLVSPPTHVKSHLPPAQTGTPPAGAEQLVAQLPQCCGSLVTSAQAPLQFV
jgi:hypothetical protein